MLGEDIFDHLQRSLFIVFECQPLITEKFVECLLFNPYLWISIDNEVQCKQIRKAYEIMINYSKRIRPKQLIDFVLNAIQCYISLDPVKYKKIIDTLWNIARSLAKDKFSSKILKTLLGYANWNYLKETANYPLLVCYALKIVLELYILEKKEFMKITKEEIKVERNSMLLSVLLAALIHIVDDIKLHQCSTDTSSIRKSIYQYDGTVIKYYKEIDSILSICIYILLEFEWSCFPELAKDFFKEQLTKRVSDLNAKTEGNLIIFLMKYLAKIKESNEIPILNSVLSRAKERKLLGRASAKAFIAVLFNKPQELLTELELKYELHNERKPKEILSFVMEQAILIFNTEAKEELINTLLTNKKTIDSILASITPARLFLKLSQDIKDIRVSTIQGNILSTFTPGEVLSLWKELAGSASHKLEVMSSWIDFVSSMNYTANHIDKKIAANCLELSYFLEDLLETHFISTSSSEFEKMLEKLILLLEPTENLYVTVPTLRIIKDEKCLYNRQQRKGGVLRIILKVIFVTIKVNKSQHSFNLLNYLLFGKDQSMAKEKISIIKLILKDKKAIQALNKRNEYYSMFIVKNKVNEEDFFMNSLSLLLYIVTLIIQLLYFDLFGVEDHKSFPDNKDDLIYIVKQYHRSEKVPSENYKQLIRVLKKLLEQEEITKMLVEDTKEYLEMLKEDLTLSSMACVVPTIVTTRSQLDSIRDDINNEVEYSVNKENKEVFWDEILKNLENIWTPFIKSLIDVITAEDTKIIEHLFESNFYFIAYPSLILLTNHQLTQLDFNYKEKLKEVPVVDYNKNVIPELERKILNQTANFPVSKAKYKRDEFRSNCLGELLYHKACKEQYSKLGCWHNKDKYMNLLFNHVKKAYKKQIKQEIEHPFNNFVKLSLKRDGMNRSMKLKQPKDIEGSCPGYECLRKFILKKMMVSKFYTKRMQYEKFGLIKNLFKQIKVENQYRKRLISEDTTTIDTPDARLTSSLSEDMIITEVQVSKKFSTFDAELIKLKGVVYGKLTLNSLSVTFKDIKRDGYENKVKVIIYKEWQLEDIKEVIVKQYNTIRQCIEIYLTNSKSVLLSLISENQLKKFLTRLKIIIKKKAYNIIIIRSPEKYFVDSKFHDLWSKGEYTNFDYLMLLNKYSDRTFNDLNQYPIFPWILNYSDSKVLDLNNKSVYRPLDKIIEKTNEENKRASFVQTNISEANIQHKEDTPYQTLLTNLMQLYTCQHNEFTFNNLESFCSGRCRQSNSELIPEFYYFPEFLRNHNLCLFRAYDDTEFSSWIKDNHRFIQMNIMALESPYASSLLDQWIDFIFGIKQQNSKLRSSYKGVGVARKTTGKSTVAEEEQRYEINVAQVFNFKHPQRSEKKIKNDTRYFIFNWYLDQINEQKVSRSFVLLRMGNLGEPIIFLESFTDRIIAITNSRQIYQSKNISISSDKSLNFKRKETPLSPFKSFFDEVGKAYRECDSERCFIILDTRIISCRHYDNSWKVINAKNGQVEASIGFHNYIVNCICTTESKDKIFTGSNDGLVAMWLLRKKLSKSPIWCFTNYTQGITSLDACERLGLVVSVGSNNNVVVRRIFDGKLVQVITPKVNCYFMISHVRFSYRGYIVIIRKYENILEDTHDGIFVYSINGELVKCIKVYDWITSIVISETGYELIIGVKSGKLKKYELLSLESKNLLEDIDKTHPQAKQTIEDLPKFKFNITAINLSKQEGYQNLLIGTSGGAVYSLRVSSKYKHQSSNI